MAIENAKTLNVRIRNKYASYEEWIASGLVLEAGEIAIATLGETKDDLQVFDIEKYIYGLFKDLM